MPCLQQKQFEQQADGRSSGDEFTIRSFSHRAAPPQTSLNISMLTNSIVDENMDWLIERGHLLKNLHKQNLLLKTELVSLHEENSVSRKIQTHIRAKVATQSRLEELAQSQIAKLKDSLSQHRQRVASERE